MSKPHHNPNMTILSDPSESGESALLARRIREGATRTTGNTYGRMKGGCRTYRVCLPAYDVITLLRGNRRCVVGVVGATWVQLP